MLVVKKQSKNKVYRGQREEKRNRDMERNGHRESKKDFIEQKEKGKVFRVVKI